MQKGTKKLETGEIIPADAKYSPETHYLIHISCFPKSKAMHEKKGITHIPVHNANKWFPGKDY